jgi:hypothetical protein
MSVSRLSSATNNAANQNNATGYFYATGGNSVNLTINGTVFTYLVFTSTGTLSVTNAGAANILCIGGGGGGWDGGGGSGGGFVEQIVQFSSTGSYTITVGAGGAQGANGTSSSIGNLLSVPGGYLGRRTGGNRSGPTNSSGYGAQGPTPGINGYNASVGGNGAGSTFYDDVARYYAGGGGGGGYNGTPNTADGGLGGGGGNGGSGGTNTGGGGAGFGQASGGASGGSGLVIVKFPF